MRDLEIVCSQLGECCLDNWSESKFEEFSKFMGFSTKGMEGDIVSFFKDMKSRRNSIFSKEVIEKTRFERELKRLEFDVNYEKGYSSSSEK